MRIPVQSSGVAARAPVSALRRTVFPSRLSLVSDVARSPFIWWPWNCIPGCVCVKQEGCPCCGPGEWPVFTAPSWPVD
jgi:hypothetical protein